MKKNKIVLLKNEHGYTFLLVFFTIILISVLGLSILKVSSNTLKTSDHERDDQSVYYIAEAGLNYGREHSRKNFKFAGDEANEKYNEQRTAYEQGLMSDPPNFEALLIAELENLGYPIDEGGSKELRDFSDFTTPVFEKQIKYTPTVNVLITLKDLANFQYIIESTGTFIEGTSIKRTLQQSVSVVVESSPPDDSDNPPGDGSSPTGGSGGGGSTSGGHFVPNEYTVQTKGNIIVNEGGLIDGNVASAGGTITLRGGASINGTIGTSPDKFNVDNEGLYKYKDQVTDSKDFPAGNVLAPFPDDRMNTLSQLSYPPNQEAAADQWNKTNVINNGNFQATNYITNHYTLNLTGDTHFKEFKVAENNTITINVGDTDKDLYIEDLNILQGHIKIIGTGKLNIYVKDSLNIKGSFNDGGDVSQINFLYSGSKPLALSNETQLNGSLYAKEADLTFSGGVGIKGNIYSGGDNVTFNNGFKSEGQHIIAPNANVNVVSGANIKGAIVADTIFVDGGASITFSESNASQGNSGNGSGGTGSGNPPDTSPAQPLPDVKSEFKGDDIIIEI